MKLSKLVSSTDLFNLGFAINISQHSKYQLS